MRWLCIAGLLFISSPAISDTETSSNSIYSFGIVPQFDSKQIHDIWRPILKELEQRTGQKFRIRGAANIPAFEKEFNSGEFDFAYMNPYHAVNAYQSQGYTPLVRDVGRALYGILVVRKDSPINEPTQLAGKTVAFPAPKALGATLLIRAELLDDYNTRVKPIFVNTHDSVYLNVVLGQTVAGGAVQKTLSRQPAAIQNQIRILHKTRKVMPHPIAAHPRVTKAIQQKVRDALLAMGEEENGRKLLAKIPMKKIGTASLKDYEELKKMGLERFHD